MRIWRGDLPWDRAARGELVQVDGPAEARRAVPTWLGVSVLGQLAGPERGTPEPDDLSAAYPIVVPQ